MFVFKIVLMGDGGVGKSSLRRKFMGKTFTRQYIMTIGADFSVKMVDLGREKVKFIIWDLAGQPHFREVRAGFYRGARGALLVYDITRRETFENAPFWMEEFLKNSGEEGLAAILVGNKIDLRTGGQGEVSTEEGRSMREELERRFKIPVDFIETSAKTGQNVEKAFMRLAELLISSS